MHESLGLEKSPVYITDFHHRVNVGVVYLHMKYKIKLMLSRVSWALAHIFFVLSSLRNQSILYTITLIRRAISRVTYNYMRLFADDIEWYSKSNTGKTETHTHTERERERERERLQRDRQTNRRQDSIRTVLTSKLWQIVNKGLLLSFVGNHNKTLADRVTHFLSGLPIRSVKVQPVTTCIETAMLKQTLK